MSDRKPGEHRWKLSWPGNFCLDCGLDDPLENTDESLINCPVPHPDNPQDPIDCDQCRGTGCVINPNLVVPPCPSFPGNAPTAGK